MKRIPGAAAMLAAALLVAVPATAQVFGQLQSAEVLALNGHQAGFYLNAGDNTLGGLAQLRMSLYPGFDFGFQGGLQRVSWKSVDRTTLRLGGDLRASVAHSGEGFPFDVAVGGGLGVETSDNYHVLTLMPSGVVSHSYGVGQNGSISPYLGLGISFANVDAGTTRQTFLSLPLRLGADFRVMPGMSLAAELQIPIGDGFNDSFGVMTGVNLPF
jgi:opacity protein-like surface antigen